MVTYLVYLISNNGVLVMPSIEKREECAHVMDEFKDFAPTGVTDLNKEGILLVEVQSRNSMKEGGEGAASAKYQIRKYSGREIISCEALDDPKMHVKFFRRHNQMVELKALKSG
jgi:hypothetical protein